MYISSDQGETQSYNPHSTSYAYAAMNVLFGELAEYNIEFDYFVGGRESADNFNVFLIPIDQEIPAKGYINANDTMILYSYGVNSFNFVTNHHYVLQNEINSLHFHQQCMIFPVASHPNQLFVLSVFQILFMLYNGIPFELVVF